MTGQGQTPRAAQRRTMRARFSRRNGLPLRVRLWGVGLLAAGTFLIIAAILWPTIPTLDGDDLWNPWAWSVFVFAWAPVILGVLLLWPSS